MTHTMLAAKIVEEQPYARQPVKDETFHLLTRVNEVENSEFSVTITRRSSSLVEAASLINQRYAWRGYGSSHALSDNEHTTTFVARKDGHIFGTLTLCADSAGGLNVDKTFPDEMTFFRHKQNSALCELTKFAVDYERDSLKILATLFHFVFIYGTENAIGTDLLIEINPRHIAFYERMLGFQRVGGLKTNRTVDAPSQLMWLSVSDIPEWIATARRKASRRSLYTSFYDARQQAAIIEDMRRRGLTTSTSDRASGRPLDTAALIHQAS